MWDFILKAWMIFFVSHRKCLQPDYKPFFSPVVFPVCAQFFCLAMNVVSLFFRFSNIYSCHKTI